MTVWFNDAYTDEDRVIAANDRGFLLADGAFETLLCRSGAVAFADAHLTRLHLGLEVLGIELPPSLKQLPQIADRLYGLCQLTGDGACRVTVSRGVGPRGLAPAPDAKPSMLVSLAPLPNAQRPPRRLVVFDRIRKNPTPFSRFKYLGGYGPSIASVEFARTQGADDALLLNDQGALVCASASNVFLCDREGNVKTPPVESGVMPGIVRETLVARESVQISELSPQHLKDHCVFLTNSLFGVEQAYMAGSECAISDRQASSLQRLQRAYERALAQSLGERVRNGQQ